jgi:hypothetical protein
MSRKDKSGTAKPRVTEDRNKKEDSIWRSAEASLQGEIVREKIKLRALERTVSAIETGISTLRCELNSQKDMTRIYSLKISASVAALANMLAACASVTS